MVERQAALGGINARQAAPMSPAAERPTQARRHVLRRTRLPTTIRSAFFSLASATIDSATPLAPPAAGSTCRLILTLPAACEVEEAVCSAAGDRCSRVLATNWQHELANLHFVLCPSESMMEG